MVSELSFKNETLTFCHHYNSHNLYKKYIWQRLRINQKYKEKKKKNISTYTHICVEKNKQRKVNIYMVM